MIAKTRANCVELSTGMKSTRIRPSCHVSELWNLAWLVEFWDGPWSLCPSWSLGWFLDFWHGSESLEWVFKFGVVLAAAPRYGFGDPTSYSLIEKVGWLSGCAGHTSTVTAHGGCAEKAK